MRSRIVVAALFLATGALLATGATAQQFNRFPNAQIDPLAGIGIARDAQGRRIIFDLETQDIIRIEGGSINARPERVRAPETIVRAPIGEATTQPFPSRQPIAPNDIGPAPEETGVSEQMTASIVKPENSLPDGAMDVARLQILLDRKGISPGVIDGQMGSNVRKALRAYQTKTGIDLTRLTPLQIRGKMDATGGAAFTTYTITAADANGPYVPSIPVDYADKALLPAMSFTSPMEKLAERFHMDQKYLEKLNPNANFWQPGTVIKVANVGQKLSGTVTRIEADKGEKQVRAYDAYGKLIAAYPATIGSAQTPSPTGTVTIERIALDPNYTYNPRINFVQGNNHEILTIQPGPNGPVGNVWLALSKPTYGIHGTPEPSRIGKTNSHGCIRLTNWDATELAGMVSKGVTVEFLE